MAENYGFEMPEPYQTPMNNPAFSAKLLSDLTRRAEEKQRRDRESFRSDPNNLIMQEIARRKFQGMSPPDAVGDVIQQSVDSPGLTRMGLFAPPGNPFKDEPSEFQDLMKHLGVIR